MLTTKILVSAIAAVTLSVNGFDDLIAQNEVSPEIAAVGATPVSIAANDVDESALNAFSPK